MSLNTPSARDWSREMLKPTSRKLGMIPRHEEPEINTCRIFAGANQRNNTPLQTAENAQEYGGTLFFCHAFRTIANILGSLEEETLNTV